MKNTIDKTFDLILNENLGDKEIGAMASAALQELEEDLKKISVEIRLSGSKDKVLIEASPSANFSVDFIKVGNPNRGGTYYAISQLNELKKAFNLAIDKAQDEVERAREKYKAAISKLADRAKQTAK